MRGQCGKSTNIPCMLPIGKKQGIQNYEAKSHFTQTTQMLNIEYFYIQGVKRITRGNCEVECHLF